VDAYILTGLVLGSIYAISSLGLVLTYTSSRVLNFAHGAIAYTCAVFYYWLHELQGWDIVPAALFTLLIFAPLLGLALWAILFRRLTHAPPEVRFVSTVGLWVALPALVKIIFPFTKAEIFEPEGIVSAPAEVFDVFGLNVNENQIAVLVGALLVVLALTVLLRATPMGLAIRGSVDSPRTAGLSGVNTSAVTAGSWMLGTGLAALAGILLTPVLGLNEQQFTALLVVSLAAAVVGRLTSLPLTFAGAMLIGLLQGLSTQFLPNEGVLALGFQPSLPFFVMLAFLLLYQGLRREKFEAPLRADPTEKEVAAPPSLRGWRAAIGPAAVAAVLLSVPLWLDNTWVNVVSQGVALAILFVTFTIVTGEGGMLSLCQATLAGVGAFTAARLATDAGWPLAAAILAGALLAVPIGMLVAAISLRLGDVYLALATLAFALLMEKLVFAQESLSNFGSGVELARPEIFGIDFSDSISGSGRVNFYFLLCGIFFVIAILAVNLRRATTGLVLAAMRSSEEASATVGISVVRAKILAFGVSAFVAGLGGGVFAMWQGRAAPTSFNVLVGIVWLAIVVTWGVRSVVGALLAGILFAVAPQELSIVLVIPLLFIVVGFITRLALEKKLMTPVGALLAVVLVAIGVVGTKLLLDVEDPANLMLAAVVFGAGIGVLVRLLRSGAVRTPHGAAGLVILIALVGAAIAWLLGLDLAEEAGEVPTLLFGLGAIFLAGEPRGVLFNFINSLRLRQMRTEARLAEEATRDAGAVA
jgi:branched-chain amino acid transport system permease protein